MHLSILIGICLVGYAQSTSDSGRASKALYDFSFDLYSNLSKHWTPNTNAVLSPMSIFSALAILEPGLGGQSKVQVLRAMHMDNVENRGLEEANLFKRVFNKTDDFMLSRANRIFLDKGLQLKKAYKQAVHIYQKTAVRRVQFNNTEKARNEINKFVCGHTMKEIKNFVKEGDITSETVMYLVNALAFKASWKTAFLKAQAKKAFTLTSSEEVRVPTMVARGATCFIMTTPDKSFEILVLPFTKSKISAIFVMPKRAGDFSELEGESGGSLINEGLSSINKDHIRPCTVELPKFEVKHTIGDLKAALRDLGVVDIFSHKTADLTPMSSAPALYVSNANHEAALKIDEEGIKADAATSFGISSRMVPRRIRINKPFMFIIRHEETGAILFMGRVVDPRVH